MSPRLPIDWDATFLGNLPEDPGTSGYPANCGVSGGARILGQVSQKGASQSIGSLGDIYFADTGSRNKDQRGGGEGSPTLHWQTLVRTPTHFLVFRDPPL